MIDYKELRPGNFVLLDTGIFFPLWHKIVPKDIYDISEGRITLESITPIPISYQLLKRCNFIDPANNGWGIRLSVNSEDELAWYHQDNSLKYQTKTNGFTRDFELKYLHRLQNFYQIVTLKELEINLI